MNVLILKTFYKEKKRKIFFYKNDVKIFLKLPK